MAMGRQGERQGALVLTWSEMPRSPGHVFYDRLQQVLVDTGFDGFVEDACKAYYARTMGAPSIPSGAVTCVARAEHITYGDGLFDLNIGPIANTGGTKLTCTQSASGATCDHVDG